MTVLRKVTQECFDTGAIPFGKLVLHDWLYAVLHWLSYSAGSDQMRVRPTCPACGHQQPQVMSLVELPCIMLHLAQPGENPTWPVWPDEEEGADVALAVLREMEREKDAASGGITDHAVTEEDLAEPWTTPPLAGGDEGDTVTWAHVRLEDMDAVEEFMARIADNDRSEGSPFSNMVLASHIKAINDQPVALSQAYAWIAGNPSYINNALKEEIAAYSYGFDIMPRFTCSSCRASYRARLPLDGGMFRARLARTRRR